jgi:hypothetical protein
MNTASSMFLIEMAEHTYTCCKDKYKCRKTGALLNLIKTGLFYGTIVAPCSLLREAYRLLLYKHIHISTLNMEQFAKW